jgi:putative transposase
LGISEFVAGSPSGNFHTPHYEQSTGTPSCGLFYLVMVSQSDNGPEITAKAVREWLERLTVKTLFIEPGSPWENGYIESFNGKMRDELLNREIFTTLEEARFLIEQWRREYNQVRPHSALGYRPPAPEAIMVKILT